MKSCVELPRLCGINYPCCVFRHPCVLFRHKLPPLKTFESVTEILINPNHSNIYLSSSRRGSSGDDLGNILDPLVQDLRAKRMDFPLTIVYGSLETMSSCYLYCSCHLGTEQYKPLGAENVARNRLFSQFHAQYPERERQRIVDGLVQGNSKTRRLAACTQAIVILRSTSYITIELKCSGFEVVQNSIESMCLSYSAFD